MKRTRIVQLKPGQRRDAAINAQTVLLEEDQTFADSFKDAFLENYGVIRGILEGYQRPGAAIIAVDHQGIAGSVCIAAKKDRINVAIVGRHGLADLFLDGDASLSLRHLVVVIHPHQGRDDPRVRVVDLRTPTAFLDEHGRQMEALEAEGPILLRLGRFRIFVLPTHDDEGLWPDSGEEGWQCVPERVYLSNLPAEPDRWSCKRLQRGSRDHAKGSEESLVGPIEGRPTDHEVPIAALAKGDTHEQASDLERVKKLQQEGESRDNVRHTIVQSISGPSRARRSLLAEGEGPLGALRIRSNDGKSTIIVGQQAISEGILFGRYERCDNEGLMVLSNGRISRVHVLLMQVADSVYAIDAGSTNGMWHEGRECRVLKLAFGAHFVLGDRLATLEWLRAR
ncbi:MAG: hypothetical protein JRH20_01145 [Deltaproteobacteria bacterium]|nr:hypothetical protein [Deltaproteobacteria bacterium]